MERRLKAKNERKDVLLALQICRPRSASRGCIQAPPSRLVRQTHWPRQVGGRRDSSLAALESRKASLSDSISAYLRLLAIGVCASTHGQLLSSQEPSHSCRRVDPLTVENPLTVQPCGAGPKAPSKEPPIL